MEAEIKSVLMSNAQELFGQEIDEKLVQFQKTRKDVEGDLTLVIFPFVKALRCSPIEAGEKIGSFLKERIDFIQSFEVVSGFLNFVIADSYWLSQLESMASNEDYGLAPKDSKPTIMVEYSSPNTNKPLHLGHLRNIFLGDSVAKLLKANGHKVVRTQIINDRGIHICKSMLAWQKFSPLDEKGERETPQNTGIKGDKFVGKYYVEFDKQFNAEAKTIISSWESGDVDGYPQEVVDEFARLSGSKDGKEEKAIAGIDAKIKDLAKNQTSLLREAKEMLIKWEARDPEVYLLWSTMNGWVYSGFESTYTQMGVAFDKLYYESDTFILGKELVQDGLKKEVFYKKEDGSVWIDLSDDGLDEKLVLRSDGTAVYMTQDVGTAVNRYQDYPDLDGIVYTVGNEQDYHFKVLFLILDKLGYSWAKNCFHLSYGMVELPKGMGKMKSREGTVVDADDLMDEVILQAKDMTQERGHIDGMTDAEKQELYDLIGLGGLKYYLLKVDPKKKLVFNPQESIELNGNTGPFIQYAHARIKSLLRKGGEIGSLNSTMSILKEEKELLKLLSEFPGMIEESAKSHSPALLCNYVYELVKGYNQFYQNTPPILKEENADLKSMRLILSKNVAKVIERSMNLIGVNVPEQM